MVDFQGFLCYHATSLLFHTQISPVCKFAGYFLGRTCFRLTTNGGIAMHLETQCLHAGYEPGNGDPRALPIYQSTTYKYDSTEHVGQLFDLSVPGHMYSRISNPTVSAVEDKIAALEGGVGALCTSSWPVIRTFRQEPSGRAVRTRTGR